MAPHPSDAHDRKSRRALNTAENALRAVSAARACLSHLLPGNVWRHRAPHGIDIKGSLKINDEHVLVLHFSSEDGSVLPKGLHGFSEGNSGVLDSIEKSLAGLGERLTVLEGAEFREPESCWAVPVVYEGRIVAHLKVAADGSNVLPEKKALEELQREPPPGVGPSGG